MENVIDTQSAIADPRCDAVDSRAAGNLEQRPHDLGEQRANELEQAEIEQQRQEKPGQKEDDDEHREQFVQHEATSITRGDVAKWPCDFTIGIKSQAKERNPNEKEVLQPYHHGQTYLM